ncbi:MAG: DUF333 domain-containing protein [Salinivirgaceae bacterium]|nr:DUF333 domain-containing protein [Salinivirgaceae bacterium]
MKIIFFSFLIILTVKLSAQTYINPAATYCVKLGYEYKTELDNNGNMIGYCLLPNGEIVNAWDFYWGKVGEEFSYCRRKGYDIVNKSIERDGYVISCPYCVTNFSEKSSGKISDFDEIPMLDLMEKNGDTLVSNTISKMEISTYSQNSHNTTSPKLLKPSTSYPLSFDWRNYNGHSYIEGVRDQGQCGSCYAFAAVASAEGAYNKATHLVDNNCIAFSEQFIMWCLSSKPEYESLFFGCEGGLDYRLLYLEALTKYGICKRNEYNPEYSTSMPSECTHWNDPVGKLSSVHHIACNDIDAIKDAIINHGVVFALVNASNFSGWSSSSGIYSDNLTECLDLEQCFESINHAVGLVGWGYDDSKGNYWIMRNSWGAGWGENGYMKIAVKSAHIGCGAFYFKTDPCIFQSQESIIESTMNINSGENVSLISSKSIHINPGFKSSNGSHFHASIQNITPQSPTIISFTNNIQIAELSINSEATETSNISMINTNIYPNPTIGCVRLTGGLLPYKSDFLIDC